MVINSVSCTSAFSQYAAKAALEGPWDPVEEMVAEFRKRRDVVVDGLNAIDGVSCVTPGGAFYAFPSIKELGATSKDVEAHLLQHAGVACLSGAAFGAHGEGYLRLSYANSIENLQAALDAMKASLPEVRPATPAGEGEAEAAM
jgi:aspartate/methionine/tyrosine aminotransferase